MAGQSRPSAEVEQGRKPGELPRRHIALPEEDLVCASKRAVWPKARLFPVRQGFCRHDADSTLASVGRLPAAR